MRKFQLVPSTIGGEIEKILSSSIVDSLLAWIGFLDGTRIRTLVNLLYLTYIHTYIYLIKQVKLHKMAAKG